MDSLAHARVLVTNPGDAVPKPPADGWVWYGNPPQERARGFQYRDRV